MERLTGRFEHPVFPGAVTVRGKRLGEAYFENTTDYQDYADALDKLAAYEDAEEQGRLIVPPCIVGDVMYYIYGGYYKPKELCTVSRPCKVKEISIKIVKGKMNYGFILDNGSRYSFSSIGKTVFFSREEAEKALEGMK